MIIDWTIADIQQMPTFVLGVDNWSGLPRGFVDDEPSNLIIDWTRGAINQMQTTFDIGASQTWTAGTARAGGPYSTAAADGFSSGAVEADGFSPGAVAADMFSTGATEADGF